MNDMPGFIPPNSQGFDYDPFDVAVTQPLQKVAGTADDNPDDAARAVDLSTATGVAAPIIATDLPGFEQVHKASLTNMIMRSNPALIDYVRSHPMAASVSNDDWSNLADVAKGSSKLHSLLQSDPSRGIMSGAISGFEEGLVTKPAMQQSIDQWLADKPLAWAITSAAAYPATELIRGFNALMGAQFGALRGGATAAYKAATGDEAGAEDFGQEMTEAANVMLAGSMAGAHEGGPAMGQALIQREAYQAAKPWLDSNLVPPRGIHPEIDKNLADINTEALDRLDEILKASQSSSTRERSYEMFHNFAEQQNGDASIGIHGPAVAALYGDKVPAPGDNLLGFAPNIGDQLLAANISGTDVHIPIKDWISQVDPLVSTQLHDDIRMFRGGITAREAQDPFEPKPVVDAPLPQARASAGLEPRFALGDRKLTLTPLGDDKYNFLDPTGKPVGELSLTPDGKDLWVDWVHGLNDEGHAVDLPNSLGPASVRDVLRQLKELYPGFTLTGDRGGGRMPQVRLDLNKLDSEAPSFLRQVDNGWRQISTNATAKVSDAVNSIAEQELRRIVGQFPQLVPTEGIRAGENVAGIRPGQQVQGLFEPRREAPPTIAWNALNPDAIGVARHEAIHYLREYGFFTPDEWAELGWHAVQNDWLTKYQIREKYPNLDIDGQTEEAVAEGYRNWAKGAEPVEEPTGLVQKAFQKMKDLWLAISDKLRSAFGEDVDVEDLLTDVHEGRIARRGPTREVPGVLQPKYSISDEDFQNIKANSLGLDIKSWRSLQDAIKARHESDLVAAVNRAEKVQRQEQTSEWKSNLRSMRGEVERTIKSRPDVAADLFVNSGEYEGQKLRQRIPLRAGDLTDEQKATLPDNYYSARGLPVDDVARLFGYQDRQHLTERLSAMAAERGDRTPQVHLKALIDTETNRRMTEKYGHLEDNIMEAASDQALSDTDINLLTEEYHAAGMLSGQATIDKNVIKTEVQEAFSKLPIGGISSQRLMAEMARHDRDAERALIGGDNVLAVKAMEQKVRAGIMAAEARKAEKQVKQFDKTSRKLYKREVTGLPQSYANFLHQILSQIGKPLYPGAARDLQIELSAGADRTLKDFVKGLSDGGQETMVWDQLFDSTWSKPYKDLTVDEFRNVKDSVDNLNYIGRQVKKITDGTTKADLNDVIDEMIDGIKSFGTKHYDDGKWLGRSGPVTPIARTALAKSLSLETVFGRWDRADPYGPWTQYGLRPLIEANSDENVMKKDVAGKLRDVYDSYKGDMDEKIHNPLFRDMTGGDLLPFNRSNLLAVMLNTGSRGGRLSNLTYLAEGHGFKGQEQHILDWVDSLATKDDWDWCQKIWDLFKDELWQPAQRMRRNLSGVGAKSLEVPPIQTKFGQYEGGYYPVIFKDIKQSAKSLREGMEGLLGEGYARATTWDGYAQERTGAYAPLSLSLQPMDNRIGQIIHDIAMRPAVLNAAKLFYNNDIQTGIKRYIGKEHADLLIPYLRDVANVSNRDPGANDPLSQLVRAMSKNVATALIGFNPGTVAKHFPTALFLSMNEVGPLRFADAFVNQFSINEETGQRNWEFAKSKFEEIANRDRNWMETLAGTSGEFIPGESLGNWRQRIAQWGAKPVALSDMLSAVPTALAAYRKAKEEGKTEGDSIFEANRAVRRAHGSSAITNRSAYQRELPSALTYYYTFFNTMLNRQAELIWKAADILGVTKEFNWADAKKALIPISSTIFATAVAPAIIEQIVSPIHFKPEDSTKKKLALITAKDLSSSWLIARDFANFAIEGRDPSLGIYSTTFHDLFDAPHDTYKAVSTRRLSKEDAGKIIKDSAGLLGVLTGFPLAAGKAGKFVYGTHVGTEHPRGPWGWATGLRYGTLAGHSPTFGKLIEGR